MRATFLFLILSALTATGCYNTNDLGTHPFRCSSDHPECPTSYVCVDKASAPTECQPNTTPAGPNDNCWCSVLCNTAADCTAVTIYAGSCIMHVCEPAAH